MSTDTGKTKTYIIWYLSFSPVTSHNRLAIQGGINMPNRYSQLISLDDTPWYHCVSRCVRRAWLCGFDTETGTDYEYRREWVVDSLELLSQVFSIEITTFAVMGNHHHVVLRVEAVSPKRWSLEDCPALAWGIQIGWTTMSASNRFLIDTKFRTPSSALLLNQYTC